MIKLHQIARQVSLQNIQSVMIARMRVSALQESVPRFSWIARVPRVNDGDG